MKSLLLLITVFPIFWATNSSSSPYRARKFSARELYGFVLTGHPIVEKTDQGEVLKLTLRQITPREAQELDRIGQLGYVSGKDLRSEALTSTLSVKCNAGDIRSAVSITFQSFEGNACSGRMVLLDAGGSKLFAADFSPKQMNNNRIDFPSNVGSKATSIKLTFVECVVALTELELR